MSRLEPCSDLSILLCIGFQVLADVQTSCASPTDVFCVALIKFAVGCLNGNLERKVCRLSTGQIILRGTMVDCRRQNDPVSLCVCDATSYTLRWEMNPGVSISQKSNSRDRRDSAEYGLIRHGLCARYQDVIEVS